MENLPATRVASDCPAEASSLATLSGNCITALVVAAVVVETCDTADSAAKTAAVVKRSLRITGEYNG